jgi:hypothetical protein
MKLQGRRAKIRFVPVNAAAQRIIEASIRSSPFPTGSGRPRHQGREGDRGQQGFQMPRRQVDDKAPDPAFAHRGQLDSDDVEVPIHRQAGLRVAFAGHI